MATPPEVADEPRRLTAWLLLAILALPAVFVWLLLRGGYSGELRTGAFLYAFAFPAFYALLLLLHLAAGGELPG